MTCCRALKSAAGGGKLTCQHNANQVKDLNTMFAAAMAELANAVEESIFSVINNKFKTSNTGWCGGRQGGGQAGGDTMNTTSLGAQISTMQKQLSSLQTVNGSNTTSSNTTMSNITNNMQPGTE